MIRTRGLPTSALLLLFAGGCGGGGGGEGAGPVDDASSVESASGTETDAVDASGPGSEGDEAVTAVDGSATDIPPAPDDASPFVVDEPGEVPDGTVAGVAPDGGEAPVPSMGDDGPADQAPVGGGMDTDALVGLWDYTRVVDGGADVALFAIGADGAVTEYDFRNDAVGDGRDCHVVTASLIASRGDDRYDIQSSSGLPGSDSIDDVLITVAGGEITFRYLGEVFDPEFGNGQAGITEAYPAVTDRRAADLVPCDES